MKTHLVRSDISYKTACGLFLGGWQGGSPRLPEVTCKNCIRASKRFFKEQRDDLSISNAELVEEILDCVVDDDDWYYDDRVVPPARAVRMLLQRLIKVGFLPELEGHALLDNWGWGD